MSTPFPSDVSIDSVFVWLIHRISDEFEDHAILKGGMELRLLNCPRSTNDLDYIFVPQDLARRTIDARVIRNEITATLSDHYPLIIEISP